MPFRISRLGYVEVKVLNLDDALDFYTNVLGLLQVERLGKQAYLKTWDEQLAYSVILTESDSAGLVRAGFRTVDPEDVDYFEKRLKQYEVSYQVIPEDYKRGKAIRFTIPSGHTFEIYYDIEIPGNLLPKESPDPWPRNLKYDAINPPKIDHMLITAPDPTKTIKFCEEVLEFRATEYIVNGEGQPVAAWLYQARQQPHDLAIIPGREKGIHHFAFHISSAQDIYRAADIMVMNDVKIDWGPGRHGITRGAGIYFFDPFGNRIETFGGYTAYLWDPGAKPIIWTEETMGKGVFYYERKLVETFLTVYT